MTLKDRLKHNDFLRKKVKKVKIFREYFFDAVNFCENYMDSCDNKQSIEYNMMLIVHSLEKGMCMTELRPFGQKKCMKLINIIKKYEKISTDEKGTPYYMSLSILKEWISIFEENNWVNDNEYKIVKDFLLNYLNIDEIKKVGAISLSKERLIENKNNQFDKFALSRHSVRNFSKVKLEDKIIEECINITKSTPTACNRQMCKVYHVKNTEGRELLEKFIMGLSGFDRSSTSYFVITFDNTAFNFFGERNQGYFNAGLFAMTFVNSLHFKGVGSCFLQWANNRKEDKIVKNGLKIPKNEKIAVVLGAGYYADMSIVPVSYRKAISEIYKII